MRARLFPSLALVTAILTLGLIVVGGVVRVTDSGLGCGNHWPLCNGTIFPPLDNLTAWIEWTHRLLALLIGLCGLGMLVLAIRHYRKQKRVVLVATVIAAFLYSIQDALGRAVVLNDLHPALVTIHLGTAMCLLGGLVVAAVAASYEPKQRYARDGFTVLAYITTALALLIIFTGGYVRGSGATLACYSWPLCNGELLPVDQGAGAMISMLHRYAVAAVGVTLALLIWSAWKNRSGQGGIRWLALLAVVTYLAQAGVGAGVIWSSAGAIWAAAHVGLAAATWALLIVLCVIESLNNAERLEGEWRPQSEPLLN
jgi:heme A synthase